MTERNRASRDWRVDNYDRVGNDPAIWFQRAHGLLLAAARLVEHCHVGDVQYESGTMPPELAETCQLAPVILMLRAMAIENLLKAVLLATGEQLTSDGRYVTAIGRNDHDLCSLADAVSRRSGLTLTAKERDVLNRLSRWITAGRYPVPKRAGNASDLIRFGLHLQGTDDLFDSLAAKLERLLIQSRGDKAESP